MLSSVPQRPLASHLRLSLPRPAPGVNLTPRRSCARYDTLRSGNDGPLTRIFHAPMELFPTAELAPCGVQGVRGHLTPARGTGP